MKLPLCDLDQTITLRAGGGCCCVLSTDFKVNPKKVKRPFKLNQDADYKTYDYLGNLVGEVQQYHLWRDPNDNTKPEPFTITFTASGTRTGELPSCASACPVGGDSTSVTFEVGGASCQRVCPKDTPSFGSGKGDNNCVDFKFNLGPGIGQPMLAIFGCMRMIPQITWLRRQHFNPPLLWPAYKCLQTQVG